MAIERITEYDELPQEADWDTASSLPDDWPSSGRLEMDEVSAKYRPNLPEALSELNMIMKSGEKIGICGRTGAGKSTLASVILRIIEPTKGEMRLDGVDTRIIGLQKLRSSITIVLQDSVQFLRYLQTSDLPVIGNDIPILKNFSFIILFQENCQGVIPKPPPRSVQLLPSMGKASSV